MFSFSTVRSYGEDPTFQPFIHSTNIPCVPGIKIINVLFLLVLKIEEENRPISNKMSLRSDKTYAGYSEAKRIKVS